MDKKLSKREDTDEENHKSQLDHIVIASPNLEALVKEFYELSGVEAVPSGRHEGKGTANYLVGLGDGAYLELIGPDPDQESPAQPRPLRVDEINKTRVVGWSVRPDHIDRRVKKSRESAYDLGDPRPMSRKTPKGQLLSWTLTPLNGGLGGTIPFLIDWGKTDHPSKGLPLVKLVSLKLKHPEPDKVKSALEAVKALHLVSEICKGEIGLEIELDTPKGRVKIT